MNLQRCPKEFNKFERRWWKFYLDVVTERGLMTAGRDTPSRLVFDTLAGPIPVRLDVGPAADAAPGAAALRVSRVSYESPRARVLAGGLRLAVAGRTVPADLVSCAGLFAIVDSESAGVALGADTLPELRRAAVPIGDAVEARARKAAKDAPGPGGVHVVFIGPSSAGSSDLRSATVAPGGHVSLSPSGRATAAIAAVLDAMGLLPGDRPLIDEGLLGLALEGRVLGRSADDPPAIAVEVSGTAWPTGDHEFVFDPGDPLGRARESG